MALNTENLQERAAKLFKENPRMQEKWIETIQKLRGTKKGWILDGMITRDKHEQSLGALAS